MAFEIGFLVNKVFDENMWELSKHLKQYSLGLSTSMAESPNLSTAKDRQGEQDDKDEKLKDMILTDRKMKTHQRKPTGATNFTVVDWGTVISKRSYGSQRIAGDIPEHYGLAARLLFLQQLLHHLLALELLSGGTL